MRGRAPWWRGGRTRARSAWAAVMWLGWCCAPTCTGAPHDLLTAYLGVRPDRLRAIVARWRQAGYAATGWLGAGPAWYWVTRAGLAVTGQPYTPAQPAAARLAHARDDTAPSTHPPPAGPTCCAHGVGAASATGG
jgi:hypothetical protein